MNDLPLLILDLDETDFRSGAGWATPMRFPSRPIPRLQEAAHDTRHKIARNYGNAIHIVPFEGDSGDLELPLLLKYLELLADAENFRAVEKRGWRSKVAREQQ